MKLMRLIYVVLFRRFAGSAAIGGGDGNWTESPGTQRFVAGNPRS